MISTARKAPERATAPRGYWRIAPQLQFAYPRPRALSRGMEWPQFPQVIIPWEAMKGCAPMKGPDLGPDGPTR